MDVSVTTEIFLLTQHTFHNIDNTPFTSSQLLSAHSLSHSGILSPTHLLTHSLTHLHISWGDYFGEPTPINWPQVSSSFGAVDLAGFPKAGAHWFQTWWLFNSSGPTRPPLPSGHSAYIVEGLDPRNWPTQSNGANRSFHVYTDGAQAELFADGKSLGARLASSRLGWLQWDVPSTLHLPSNLTVVAKDVHGHPIARHERVAASTATALRLSLDVPHVSTGTGSKVVLDGHDVALVRAAVVDGHGNVVTSATHNVTFTVRSGPGRVLGVGNGDPACHEPNQVPWRSAYHGLVRGIIKVTQDAAEAAVHRQTMSLVDVDGAKGQVHVVDPSRVKGSNIVVLASADGLSSAELEIQVSTDTQTDGVLAAAKAHLLSAISLE